MPKNLMRRYDVMDFATPVQTVDAMRVEGSSRLVISAQGDFEQLAYQSDNQYTVEIKPSLEAHRGAEEKKEYTGERLTLNFQDIDVRSVLQLLADTSGQNIVVSDSVTGNLTLRLQNVPWDQALDIVLRTKGLDKRRQDNVIIIGPTEELASREKAELAAHKEVQELSPTHTEFMQVNYAKVADLAKLIKPHGSAKDSMLSPRGSLSIDERTNTLLVQDTVGQAGGHPPPGADLGRAGQAGVDRSAHRDRQRHLRARPGRALRCHAPRRRTAPTACSPSPATASAPTPSTQFGDHRSATSSLVVPVRRRPSTIATRSICRPRTPTAASASRCWAAATWSTWNCRRRKTKARARPSPRRASSPRTRSRPPSCRVSKFPIRNRPRAAPRPRSSRTPCCRSR